MAAGPQPTRRLEPPAGIPRLGLEEILGGFSSGGEALDALDSFLDDRDWRRGMARARLDRLLLDDLTRGPLERWPRLTAEWLEALPAASYVEREHGVRARAVDWRATARLGWPPEQLVTRPRRRDNDQLLLTALRWTLERLRDVRNSARRAWKQVGFSAQAQIDAALELLDLSPVADARAVRPDPLDLQQIAGEGSPWNVLVPVAVELLRYDQASPGELARLIAPEDTWRLFHLAVLGDLVRSAREAGRDVRSTGPVAGGAHCYEIDQLQVWMEGGGYNDKRRPYDQLALAARGTAASLTPDLVLRDRVSGAALLIEVKWYLDGTEALRDGLRAALAYALDAEAAVADVAAVAVLPDSQVEEGKIVGTTAGPVGVAAPRYLGVLLEAFADGGPAAILQASLAPSAFSAAG